MKPIVPLYIQGGPCHWNCRFCHPTQGMVRPGWEALSAQEFHARLMTYWPKYKRPMRLALFGWGTLDQSQSTQNALLKAVDGGINDGHIDDLRLSLRPDQVDGSRLQPYVDRGLSAVEIWVPTLEPAALKWLGPDHGPEPVERVIQTLRALNLEIIAHTSPGMPGSTARGDLHTAKMLTQWAVDGIRLTPTLVLNNTHLEEAQNRGIFAPLTLSEAAQACAALLDHYEISEIPVTRVGWQPSDLRIAVEEIVDGPYHSSFRIMAESTRLFDRVLGVLQLRVIPGEPALIRAHPSEASYLRGLQNVNLIKMRQRFQSRTLTILDDAKIRPGTLELDTNNRQTTLRFSLKETP